MLLSRGKFRAFSCALAVLAIMACGCFLAPTALADGELPVLDDQYFPADSADSRLTWLMPSEEKSSAAAPYEDELVPEDVPGDEFIPEGDMNTAAPGDFAAEPWIEEYAAEVPLYDDYAAPEWGWHWAPTGLIYHTYMAGVHQPRMGINAFRETVNNRTLWDATLGGRVGFVQYGNGDPVCPAGYQLDFYGAAIARLDVENQQDLDSTDYIFGMPLTWGDERLQYQFGYAHISSHLGDEFAISHPGSLAARVNYVRDSLIFGTSYYVVPAWRVYGELGYAFHTSGGAEPFETQFGTELSRPGPTDSFTPFVAVNARLREEHDFSGDFATQAGWLRRGLTGQTLRFGGHLYTGKSSQFQFFRESETQLGLGLWYDY